MHTFAGNQLHLAGVFFHALEVLLTRWFLRCSHLGLCCLLGQGILSPDAKSQLTVAYSVVAPEVDWSEVVPQIAELSVLYVLKTCGWVTLVI